jgi:hypothetical protein
MEIFGGRLLIAPTSLKLNECNVLLAAHYEGQHYAGNMAAWSTASVLRSVKNGLHFVGHNAIVSLHS